MSHRGQGRGLGAITPTPITSNHAWLLTALFRHDHDDNLVPAAAAADDDDDDGGGGGTGKLERV